MTQIHLPVKY